MKRELKGKRVVITGGSEGLGLAMVRALTARGARVTVIARHKAKFAAAERTGAATVSGDATDAALMHRCIRDEAPDVLILNAGARLPMKPIDEQSWEEFSVVWNTDVKGGLVGIRAALKAPMKPGGRVLLMSSGAAMVLSVPYIEPEGLRLSGGYTGAKRMLWFMAHAANAVSRERELGLHFQAALPAQLVPGTALGHQVAAAYADVEGVTPEEHVMHRYGSILHPAEVGAGVCELLADPVYADGVAYGIKANSEIMSLDV